MRDEEILEIIDRAEAGVAESAEDPGRCPDANRPPIEGARAGEKSISGPDSDRARAPGRASAADGVPPERIIHNP